ncbi:hypothetical protein SG34_010630 [Thalassomonas viridans]|uniref:Uncharacterized protein n=1 Tax=Thalassomonas viridans TaxID=137584 RepID=A0AAE9Z5U5_9GAMM|nr:hypothetical protein [Thalassomonas viridans]WDE07301.1 hypothetical protein SG34_010630 [Thalassomonas viridans]
MPCKIVVMRQVKLKSQIGDVVGAYSIEQDLGDQVEPVGGAFVIINVTDAEVNHPAILQLTAHIEHDNYERQYYLNPVQPGHEFYEQFVANGKITTDLVTLQSYILERAL